MKQSLSFVRLLIAILIILIVASMALAGDNKDDIKTRAKKRYSQLKKLKKAKLIGETHLGTVKPVTEKAAKDELVKKIVAAENADRQELYAIIAKEMKTTAKAVAKNNAHRIFKKAGMEEYFKGKDGKWRKKKDMYTRFRASEAFKELDDEVKKLEKEQAQKKKQ